MFCCRVAGVNGQVQGISAWTTIRIGISIGVSSSGVIQGSLPSVAVASIENVTVMRSMVYSQVEQHKAVTSIPINSQKGRGKCAGIIGAAMP